MSTVQQLINDLSNLASESKRRNSEIRHACDKAITDLKSYQPQEKIHDISQNEIRMDILKPFLISCNTGNAKFATISIPIIHKLIIGEIIPVESLNELLDSLKEATNLATDIQLRILQCLPTLMQNYNRFITNSQLLKLLGICSSLTASNKSTVVINTASATLQQLFSNVYDKIEEGGDLKNELKIDNDETIKINDSSLEGFKIFNDLCGLIENEKPAYFTEFINIKSSSVLEIIESILSNHKGLFDKHQELCFLVRVKIIPALLRILNAPTQSFPMTIRTIRIFHVLLASQLDNLEVESEIVLSFLNHMLINGNNDPSEKANWVKIAVLEMFRGLFLDFSVINSIYDKYDNNPKKKNVIQELMSILCTYLLHNAYIMNDVVKPPPTSLSQNQSSSNQHTYLSKQSSNMKISTLDHLDKQESPASIPPNYPIYLTFSVLLTYTDGIAKFVNNLSDESNLTGLEANVEFVTALIENTYPEVSSLFERFIYSYIDNDGFHQLVRTLQKFTHATGLLGLGSLRDGLLGMLSKAIIRNTSKNEIKANQLGNSGFQEQGKQLLALGESVVESFSSSLQKHSSDHNLSSQPQSQIKSRSFNSRQVICLRALANLAVSLGSTLQDLWSIIWITFQWCDYYMNGPDEYSGYLNNKNMKFTNDMLPKLTASDLNNIEISKKKFFESINEYQLESFHELIAALTNLSDEAFSDAQKEKTKELEAENENGKDKSQVIRDQMIVCPYNKVYFLKMLGNICQINPNKFLIENDKSWNLICDYFINLGAERGSNIGYTLRIYIVNTFDGIIKDITHEGFESTESSINVKTSQKSLDGLRGFLDKLFKLGLPNELLVLNCETEMHLLVLTTLHELIDKFDEYYQNSWHTVFRILNTSFRSAESGNEDNNLKEKVRLVIDSSFNTLKLILDEFMSSLPFDQMHILIETLYNFCHQKYDLNISFSSVSYFWLISDSLKSKILSTKETQEFNFVIKTDAELIKIIENEPKENQTFYKLLDIYLLSTLSKLSTDSRAQVRDGAIQTFFQIIDVHGSLLPSWDLIYEIVLPTLLNLEIDLDNSKFNKKEWIESLNLILSGLVSIYGKFMMDFGNSERQQTLKYFWEGLIKYFNRLLGLKWVDLNLKSFKSFHDLLVPFDSIPNIETEEVRNLLFEFWVNVPVEYDFVNPLYQDSLSNLMKCFPPLYKIVKDSLDIEKINTIINMLNRCARYPVLPSTHLDNVRPSQLQRSVIDNLECIDLKDPYVRSCVIQQLSSMLVYPFGTKMRIEQKLGAKLKDKVTIPTFIAVSHLSMLLLREKLNEVDDYKVLLKEKTISRLFKSLLEVIKMKATGIEKREYTPLWIEANHILKFMTSKLVKDNLADLRDDQNATELWKLIITGVNICFESETDPQQETVNISQYFELSEIVLPALMTDTKNETLMVDFIENVYYKSFLYKNNDIEDSIQSSTATISEFTSALANFNFDTSFGSAKTLDIYSNRKTRVMCLQELIKFSHLNVDSTKGIRELSLQYFVCRAAFIFRRFISEEMLLHKSPLPKIQQEELLIAMDGILGVQKTLRTPEDWEIFDVLYVLLTKSIPFASRIDSLDSMLAIALQSFSRTSS